MEPQAVSGSAELTSAICWKEGACEEGIGHAEEYRSALVLRAAHMSDRSFGGKVTEYFAPCLFTKAVPESTGVHNTRQWRARA